VSKEFLHEDDSAGFLELYSAILHSPEIQECLRNESLEISDLAHLLLPELGVAPAAGDDWKEALQEACMTWISNDEGNDLDD
jgi:hypothetical protein